jgi:hypothetical protein
VDQLSVGRLSSSASILEQYCGPDTSGSAFYLATWESDDPEIVRDRLDRISSTPAEHIGVLVAGSCIFNQRSVLSPQFRWLSLLVSVVRDSRKAKASSTVYSMYETQV